MGRTDNSNLAAKVQLRAAYLRTYHSSGGIVFDACQGDGKVWGRLRKKFAVNYQGADITRKGHALPVDSRRMLSVEHWKWDIVDIDTYGEPWAHWEALCKTADHDCTVFLTWGHIAIMGGQVSRYPYRAMSIPQECPQALVASLAPWSLPYLLHFALRQDQQIEDIRVCRPNPRVDYVGLRLLVSV